jgi:formiminoglutamase
MLPGFPIVLGGGHDVAYGHFKGLLAAQKNGDLPDTVKKMGIINFDAHFDLRPYSQGPHSGSAFLQIADELKKQGRDFHYLVLGIQHASNTGSLFATADRLKTRYLLAEEINLEPLERSKKVIQDFIDSVDAIYLTFCLDALPLSHAPGVSAPNPYGLNPYHAVALFKHIVQSKKLISFDVAELSPPYDVDNHTAKLAAYLVFELIRNLGI